MSCKVLTFGNILDRTITINVHRAHTEKSLPTQYIHNNFKGHKIEENKAL